MSLDTGNVARIPHSEIGNTEAHITDAGALTLSSWIKRREVSCEEVMRAYLNRIDQCNPSLNAIVSRVDSDILLSRATERDKQLAAGDYLGPLHGFPQAPKDLASVGDMPTSMGSPLFAGKIPAADSVVMERIRRNGALFVGRTNTPEFGLGGQTYNPVFGATRNPWDLTKTPAGSSGGAAVALAARMLPVADGSDMMGSLRTPAAYNNVFGFRNSRGVIPYGPGPELYLNQFSYDGAMARNVPDLALLLSVMAGHDARVPLSTSLDASAFADFAYNADASMGDYKGVRIGWLSDMGGQLPIEPEVLTLCETALETFKTIGCSVEHVDVAKFGVDMPTLFASWTTLRSFIMAGNFNALYRDPVTRSQFKPEMIWEIEKGLALSGSDIYDASVQRSSWHTCLSGLFAHYDYVVLPSAQLFPYDVETHWPKRIAGRDMDTYHRWMEVVVPASLAGAPAISVPAGFSTAGLPMGIQIIGPVSGDLDVLKIAHAYDIARGRAETDRPVTSDGMA